MQLKTKGQKRAGPLSIGQLADLKKAKLVLQHKKQEISRGKPDMLIQEKHLTEEEIIDIKIIKDKMNLSQNELLGIINANQSAISRALKFNKAEARKSRSLLSNMRVFDLNCM